MPQASDELRAQWKDDGEAEAYLRRYGITNEKGMFWNLPVNLPPKAQSAVDYLCDEWDFGVGSYAPSPASKG